FLLLGSGGHSGGNSGKSGAQEGVWAWRIAAAMPRARRIRRLLNRSSFSAVSRPQSPLPEGLSEERRMPASPLIACKHPVTGMRSTLYRAPRLITVPPMSRERSDAQQGAQAPPQRAQARLRVAVIDRDPGFMQVLANRLGALGCEHRA